MCNKRQQTQKLKNDLTLCTLDNLCSLRKETCNPANSGLDKYIGLEHIDSGKFFLNRHGTPKEVRSSKNRFTKNDVLYGKLRPYLDKAVVADREGICSTDILVFIPNEQVPPYFLVGVLHSDKFIQYANQTTHGVNHPRTSWTSLKEFDLKIPSLTEQQNIAAVLFKIQKAIEVQERIIETTRELKKSTMQHVFTYGLRGEKTKETEIGRIPESWEIVHLEEVCEIERGKFTHRPRNDPDYYGGEIPFVQTGDVANSNGRIKHYSQTLNELGLSVSKIFPAGTILITIAANIGDTGILEFDSAFPDSIIGLTPNERINSYYLEYYLRIQKQKMVQLAPKGTQMNINIQFLRPWPVYLPSQKEQREIVNILQKIDEKIELHTEKKSALQALFKTMLYKLMTGEIRVKDMDVDMDSKLFARKEM